MGAPKRIRQTSIAVYNKIRNNGLLSKRRWEVYDILYHHGPLTSNEIFQHAQLHGNPNYRHNTNARMTELREMGVAEEIGVTKCSVTGHEVILWDVTANLPSKFVRGSKPTRRQLEEENKKLRIEVARLRRLIGLKSPPPRR